MTHIRTVWAGVAATLLTISVGIAWAEVSPSNKWRLEFSGSADSDGVIELKITPEGGEDMLAGVNISKRTSENKVAQAVVDALRAQLPEETYHIERDDGEDVLIKKKRGAENFAVEIVYNSVEGVRINPQHE
jgi:hypothetical protein